MMLVPRGNGFDLFDDFFENDFLPRNLIRKENSLMKTDIKEKDDKYIFNIDLPGFEKENINISLDNGYLNIKAKLDSEKDDDDEKYVRKERYYGECSRSFYIGDQFKEEDIHAEFKNGILNIELLKKQVEDNSKDIKQIPIN